MAAQSSILVSQQVTLPSLTGSCACACCVTVLTLPSILPSIDLQLVVAGLLLGTLGTNVCPAGSVSMGTLAECESAATALGYTFTSSLATEAALKGCYLYNTIGIFGNVYFNTHETGAASPYRTFRSICAGGACSFVCTCECTCLRVRIPVLPSFFLFFCCS